MSDRVTDERLVEVLQQYWGFAELRPMQDEAIRAAMGGRDSLLIMPTGGGKSLCYQVPPLLDDCLDIVVSPLISLMKDQVDGLKEAGVPAAALYSGMTEAQRREVNVAVGHGELRLLFVSPERLMADGFVSWLKRLNIRRFAIDEAHCISQWGHDFRPEYRQLATLRDHFPDATLHAFTATATPRVRDDIVHQLKLNDPAVLVGAVDRANLTYRVVPKVDAQQQVLEIIARHADEAAIVYCISRKETESLAEWLAAHDISAAAYHAGLSASERHRVQEAFANEKLNVVVATVAFGMGIDRSNVRSVIHTGMPKSLEHYQQETGRAGRDGLAAECVLLYSAGDAIKWERIISGSAAEAEDPETLIAASMALLQHMQRFASAPLCRHRALTEYFGQQYEKANCDACDVCLDEIDAIADSNVIAQKILSCVARTGQRFGVGQVVDVLQGARTENVRRFGHDQLSTYGLLKELDKKTVTALVYQLLDQQVLARSDGEFPTLRLNTASTEILRGTRNVKLVQPPVAKQKASRQAELDVAGADAGLMQHLRQWRRALAQSRGVPPYTIFPDTTLVALARHRPTRHEHLLLISGIGQHKADQYGSAICEQITSYCAEHDLSTDQFSQPTTRRAARPPVAKPRSDSIKLAFALFREGKSMESVAQQTGRALSTVCQYLEQFIREERPADISRWVSHDTVNQVLAAIGDEPVTALRPIYQKLNEKVPYEAIRIVLVHVGPVQRETKDG